MTVCREPIPDPISIDITWAIGSMNNWYTIDWFSVDRLMNQSTYVQGDYWVGGWTDAGYDYWYDVDRGIAGSGNPIDFIDDYLISNWTYNLDTDEYQFKECESRNSLYETWRSEGYPYW